MAIYGYCRCSTNETKQNVKRQVRELKELGADFIYEEYVSGTRSDRKEYNKMLKAVSDGDTIVATEVSRLTRSTLQLCELMQLAKSKHLKIMIKDSMTLDYTTDKPDPIAEAMVSIAGVFAQLEHEVIVQRIKSGMETARANGKHLGREAITPANMPKNIKRQLIRCAPLLQSGDMNHSELARLCDLSRPTVLKYLDMLYAHGDIGYDRRANNAE